MTDTQNTLEIKKVTLTRGQKTVITLIRDYPELTVGAKHSYGYGAKWTVVKIENFN